MLVCFLGHIFNVIGLGQLVESSGTIVLDGQEMGADRLQGS